MKKRLLLFATLIILGLRTLSQTGTFYETISIPYGYTGIMGMVKSYDGNLILLSTSVSSEIHLTKVDTLGNLIWQKDITRESGGNGSPFSMIEAWRKMNYRI